MVEYHDCGVVGATVGPLFLSNGESNRKVGSPSVPSRLWTVNSSGAAEEEMRYPAVFRTAMRSATPNAAAASAPAAAASSSSSHPRLVPFRSNRATNFSRTCSTSTASSSSASSEESNDTMAAAIRGSQSLWSTSAEGWTRVRFAGVCGAGGDEEEDDKPTNRDASDERYV